MGVVSAQELKREFDYEIGQPMKLTREWVCVLDDNTLENNATSESSVIDHVGIYIGSIHPTYQKNACRAIRLREGYEGSPYHVHITYEYGPVLANELVTPVNRAYVWEANNSIGETLATSFYDGTTRRPLTNSAYDFFPGLTMGEGIGTATVTGNFATWPGNWFAANNTINSAVYAGCPIHTLKVTRVTCRQEVEQFGNEPVAFWRATAEIQYRETGHNLLLPDVGWNYISSGQKRRAMVFDFENDEWVPSPNPIGLDGAGAPSPTGWPAILNRRVNVESNFQTLFGNFPSSPLPVHAAQS